MDRLNATWLNQDNARVPVEILAFVALQQPAARPVAIVADPTDSNRLRWVELKFLELRQRDVA
jgi:hypothetical protein